jgi:transcriptional regulator with XRE-family HTH domain
VFDPLRIGRSLRAIRVRLDLRQLDVAVRAAVSRSFVSNLERGLSRSTDIGRIEAVCRALGADLDVRVRWRGEGLDRLLDEGHATVVDRLVALLESLGWQTWLEVTFNDYGDRGSIDVSGGIARRGAC